MALSGTLTTNTITDYGLTTSFQLTWTATQSITNNTSTVAWKVKTIQTPQGSGYQRTIMGGSTVTVNGTNYNISSGQGAYNGLQIASGNTVITHNDDGTKSFTITLKVSLGYASSNSNTATATFTLDTIARASSVSLNKNSMLINGSNSVVVTITKKNSSFTDDLSYSFNGTTGTISSNVGTSYTWVVPLSLLNAIPDKTSASCEIICTTYNGETAVGTSSATITLSTDAVPIITASITNTTKKLDNSSYTANWLRYHSTGTITGSATSQGSSIVSYRIVNNNVQLGTNLPCNVSNLTTNTIVITATDARGNTGSLTLTLTPWVDYVKPTLAIESIARASNTSATSDATISVSGTATQYSALAVSYTLSASYSGGNTSKTLSNDHGNTWNDSLTLQGFQRALSYDITVSINDTFEEYTVSTKLKKAVPVFHFGNNPTPHFDVEGDLIIHGSSSKIIWIDDNGQAWEMDLTTFKSLI